MKRRIKLKSNSNKNKVVLVSILVFFNSIFILYIFNKNTKPVLVDYAKNKIELETRKIIVNVLDKEFNNKNEYEELINNVYNSKDEIIFIDYNSLKIDSLLNNINLKLLEELKNLENNTFYNNSNVFYIPFNSITSLGSTSWVGPWIPIKIMTSGNIEVSLETNIKEYGINNALIETDIKVIVYTNILLPYVSDNVKVEYSLPIIKKVINGKIPSVYGGVYSSSSNIITEPIE